MTREQRRLAAIVSADVVGYSRLMGRDEAGTLARLREHRKQRFEPILARHGGRLVKLTGDGALAEFPSAVEAVAAAIEFQQVMADANRDQPEDTAIVFRLGLHLGDLIVEGDDLYGDGVNVAARLEGEAPPGGIVISGNVHDAVAGRLKATFDDLGDLTLKNIERPVRAFRVGWTAADWEGSPRFGAMLPPSTLDTPPELIDRPSIVVLPFICLGGTPEQEAFADGITHNLTTDLSRQSGLSVIARTTALSLKGETTDARTLGRKHGVRYVLEGTVQFGAQRVRVSVQLTAASDGVHLWADRFDKDLGDLLDLQDEIAERTSRALAVQLREAEIRRAARQPHGTHDAATLLLLGRQAFMQGASSANASRARALYAEALKLDDRNPTAYAALATNKVVLHLARWSDTAEDDLQEAMALIDRARALDPNHPFTHVASAWVLVAQRNFAAALTAFDRIAQAAPTAGGNAAANLAFAKNNVGRSAEALTDLLRVIRVTPSDPQMDWWYYYLGVTYIYLDRYQDAVAAFRHAISLNADFDLPYLCLAAVCVQLDRREEARAAVQRALSIGTRWTVRSHKEATVCGIGVGIDDSRMIALWDGLRQAGLPE